MAKNDKKTAKAIFYKKVYELLSKYKQIIVVSLSNVGSKQVQDIRRLLNKKKSVLIVGKNTIIASAIRTKVQGIQENHPFYDELKRYGGSLKELETLLT